MEDDKPVSVTIRSRKCIEYLKDRKEQGIPYSAAVTDLILDHIDAKAERMKPVINVFEDSNGTFRAQPSGPPRFEGKIPFGSVPTVSMAQINSEMREVFDKMKRGKRFLKKTPEDTIRHKPNK